MQTMPNPARYHTTHNKTTVKKGCTMIPKRKEKPQSPKEMQRNPCCPTKERKKTESQRHPLH
jgi:hypothetical protein